MFENFMLEKNLCSTKNQIRKIQVRKKSSSKIQIRKKLCSKIIHVRKINKKYLKVVQTDGTQNLK